MAYKVIGSRNHAASATRPALRPTGVYQGNLTIHSEFEALYYSRLTGVTGNITVAAGYGGRTFSMPLLTSLGDFFTGGGLYFEGSDFLEEVSMPLLATATGSVDFRFCPKLAVVSFPSLTTAWGFGMTFGTGVDAALTTVDITALQTAVGMGVIIQGVPHLQALDLSVATDIWLMLESCPDLTTVSAPNMTTSPGIMLTNMTGLTSVSFPALVTIPYRSGFPGYLNGIYITACLGLTSISLPALTSVGGRFLVQSCTLLTTLDVPLLTTVGEDVDIVQNDALPDTPFPALTSIGHDLYVMNNGSMTVPTTCTFDVLQTIGGLTHITGQYLTSVSFPALTSTVGEMKVEVSGVTSMSMPLLATLGGDLVAITNPSLTNLTLPSLLGAAGVQVNDNVLLDTLSLPVLQNVTGFRGLEVQANTALATVNVPDLISVVGGNGVSFYGLPALTALSFPSLTTATYFNLQSCLNLASLDVPLLEGDMLQVRVGNTQVASLDLSGITSVTGLGIESNSVMTTLDVSGLVTVGALSITVTGNDALSVLSFPALTTINVHDSGTLSRVSLNAALTTLNLPVLTDASILDVNQCGLLDTIYAPVLAWADELRLWSLGSLITVDFPLLAHLGTLEVSNNTLLNSLTFPALATVAGGGAAITVQSNPALATFSIPVFNMPLYNAPTIDVTQNPSLDTFTATLLSCAAYLRVDNSALVTLNLPAMVTVGALVATNNLVLTTINLPLLTAVSSLLINTNPQFVSFTTGSLASCTGSWIGVYNNASLVTLPMTWATGTYFSITFEDNPLLEAVVLPNVTSVTNNLAMSRNDSVISVNLWNLVNIDSSLSMIDNHAFRSDSLYFPALFRVGTELANAGPIIITGNSTAGEGLTDAVAHALVAQLTGTGGGPAHDLVTNVTISNNNPY